jgi:sugar lactone lactonase YvrE
MSSEVLHLNWQVVSPLRQQLGESPFWHPDEQRLYWVDIPAREILRSGPQGEALERWALPSEPGCIAPARAGGWVIALRDGIYRARDWGGELTCLARLPHDPQTTRSNDGRCDPLGRFWVGTMYEPKDRRLGALYSLDARTSELALSLQADDNVTANGLAFAPDQGTVYWADTGSHRIHAWRWDVHTNAMTEPRVWCQLPGKPSGFDPDDLTQADLYGGRPDGAAVDVTGCYWSAQYEGGQLLKIAPSGEVLARVPLPARCPTMPCFGGPDGRTLFVTTASKGRPSAELDRWPLAGCVLSARVEVPGLATSFFVD